MTKIEEYGRLFLAPMFTSSDALTSKLTHGDQDTLRKQCEDDLCLYLEDAGHMRERNRQNDSHDD